MKVNWFMALVANERQLDKYRTAAMEIGIGKYSAGFNIYTGDNSNLDYKHQYLNKPEDSPNGAYCGVDRVNSAWYIGYRNGKQFYRFGWDGPGVQNIIQNGWHKLIGSPYYEINPGDYGRPYFYYGTNNLFSLY